MSTWLRGALLAADAIALIIIGSVAYWTVTNVRQVIVHVRQLLGAAQILLALAPGKSAPRTDAGPDVQPAGWKFARLIEMEPDEPITAPMRRPVPGKRTDTSPEMEAITAGTDAAEQHAQYGRHASRKP